MVAWDESANDGFFTHEMLSSSPMTTPPVSVSPPGEEDRNRNELLDNFSDLGSLQGALNSCLVVQVLIQVQVHIIHGVKQ